MAVTGGCLCGAVRYRIEAEPIATRTCWCRACQFIAAGSATVNVVFPSATVAIEGALVEHVTKADSGNRVHRRFCAKCGTPVTTQSEARPHLLSVRAGTLDDTERGKPELTIWISAAPSWAPIDPRIPSEAKQPPPPAMPAKA
jgi:hypothetical protein